VIDRKRKFSSYLNKNLWGQNFQQLLEQTDVWMKIKERYQGMFDLDACVHVCVCFFCVCNSHCLHDIIVPLMVPDHLSTDHLSTPSSSSPIYSYFRPSDVISTFRRRLGSDSKVEEATRTVITKERRHDGDSEVEEATRTVITKECRHDERRH
jgi:hypothetical protein